jgi:hypothetical protein
MTYHHFKGDNLSRSEKIEQLVVTRILILNDGDSVEVNANLGFVKKI